GPRDGRDDRAHGALPPREEGPRRPRQVGAPPPLPRRRLARRAPGRAHARGPGRRRRPHGRPRPLRRRRLRRGGRLPAHAPRARERVGRSPAVAHYAGGMSLTALAAAIALAAVAVLLAGPAPILLSRAAWPARAPARAPLRWPARARAGAPEVG